MGSAILQIGFYSLVVFGAAWLLRPDEGKPRVQYMSQNKVINKERVW